MGIFLTRLDMGLLWDLTYARLYAILVERSVARNSAR